MWLYGYYFHLKESPLPPNIPTPTPAPAALQGDTRELGVHEWSVSRACHDQNAIKTRKNPWSMLKTSFPNKHNCLGPIFLISPLMVFRPGCCRLALLLSWDPLQTSSEDFSIWNRIFDSREVIIFRPDWRTNFQRFQLFGVNHGRDTLALTFPIFVASISNVRLFHFLK